jgi:hypothetical protein
VGAHDNAVDVALAEVAENLVGRKAGTHHHLAVDAGLASALDKGLELLDFGAGGGGVVVVADARGFRGSHDQRVVGVKDNEIGSEFPGLRESVVEGAFVGRDFRSKEDGGGAAPTRLVGHGNLLRVLKDIRLRPKCDQCYGPHE